MRWSITFFLFKGSELGTFTHGDDEELISKEFPAAARQHCAAVGSALVSHYSCAPGASNADPLQLDGHVSWHFPCRVLYVEGPCVRCQATPHTVVTDIIPVFARLALACYDVPGREQPFAHLAGTTRSSRA